MALFEIETSSHIMISWADSQADAEVIARKTVPTTNAPVSAALPPRPKP